MEGPRFDADGMYIAHGLMAAYRSAFSAELPGKWATELPELTGGLPRICVGSEIDVVDHLSSIAARLHALVDAVIGPDGVDGIVAYEVLDASRSAAAEAMYARVISLVGFGFLRAEMAAEPEHYDAALVRVVRAAFDEAGISLPTQVTLECESEGSPRSLPVGDIAGLDGQSLFAIDAVLHPNGTLGIRATLPFEWQDNEAYSDVSWPNDAIPLDDWAGLPQAIREALQDAEHALKIAGFRSEFADVYGVIEISCQERDTERGGDGETLRDPSTIALYGREAEQIFRHYGLHRLHLGDDHVLRIDAEYHLEDRAHFEQGIDRYATAELQLLSRGTPLDPDRVRQVARSLAAHHLMQVFEAPASQPAAAAEPWRSPSPC